jgi:D-inositol-3-phosphate glycosyltransferase
MNVYIAQVARRLAGLGLEVDIFTRAAAQNLPPVVELAPGVTVRHLVAGPKVRLGKEALLPHLPAFTAGMVRAGHERAYDVIHTHYWLSGQVGLDASQVWGVPLVHSSHTLAKVKNALLATGDRPESLRRVAGEERLVAEAQRLVANAEAELDHLVQLYGADPRAVGVVAPGVDLDRYHPGDRFLARQRRGLAPESAVLLFVGRIQPLKAPDVLIRAAHQLLTRAPCLREHLVVVVCGGPSGSGLAEPGRLARLAEELGVAPWVRFIDPLPPHELADLYRAADLTVVPSHSESFGLVAAESQAVGTPVVAAAVGGLTTTVTDGVSGVLVPGHDPDDYAQVFLDLLAQPERRAALGRGARAHAARFSWEKTAEGLRGVYEAALAERKGCCARSAW